MSVDDLAPICNMGGRQLAALRAAMSRMEELTQTGIDYVTLKRVGRAWLVSTGTLQSQEVFLWSHDYTQTRGVVMLTEAEAWRMIGEAFEARAAHPELGDDVDLPLDIAQNGMCAAIDAVRIDRALINYSTQEVMERKVNDEVRSPENASTLYLLPWTNEPGGPELRATLAYLFAEEAAA